MRSQAQSFGAAFTADKVQGIDLLSEEKTVFANNGTYMARSIIIATGSMGRGQRVKGEDELLGHGVSYCATCDAAFFRGQDVIVAGSSDEAVEEALFLTKFVRSVAFLSPTPELKAPGHLVEELEDHPKVSIFRGAALREIIGEGRVEAVRFALRGQGEQTIPVTGAFIYLQGGKPITDFLQGQLDISQTGCLAVVAAAEGAVAGMAVEKVLRGRKQLVADWSK